ncbi:MAG: ATP-binding protein, partial [Candidatus Cloacimonetes bacterium]|nr:ATP-binding protein [Candidatus Cloacimonadota bacterium]
MEDLSLHILDVVENSIEAKASIIEIKIVEDKNNDLLAVEIKDNGRGMNKETINKVLDPFYTTRTTRKVGMGLSLLAQAARESNGNFEINSKVGEGTEVKAVFQYSHIDRKPIGDMKNTLITLMVSHPEINFVYEHQDEDGNYVLDS